MASGHRKRLAAAVRANLLTPAGLTNYATVDQGVLASQTKLAPTALYASGATSPTFTEGSTTILSDAISNADGNWTLMGYAGETKANTTYVTGTRVFLPSTAKHRYLPLPGEAASVQTDSVPVVIYSKDGPQGYFNQSYFATANKTAPATGTIQFGNQITGANAGGDLMVWIAGAVPTGTVGSTVSVYTSSVGTGTALITFKSSVTPAMTSASFTPTAASKITVVYSSSANTYNLNSFVPGVLVYISGTY